MKTLITLFAIINLLIVPLRLNSQIFQNWSARYNGTGNSTDEANAITTDPLGNIFITGASRGNGWDCATLKYTRCGQFRLLRTTNSGFNWTKIITNTTSDLNKIIFTNQQYGFIVGKTNTLLITSNSGNNWIRKEVQFNSNLTDIYFINNSTGYITGTNGIILSTYNGGNNWQRINTYSSVDLTAITFIDSGKAIIASSDGRLFLSNNGEFYHNASSDYRQTENRVSNTILNKDFQLFQNYPNPFNPETEIKYNLQENSRVTIKIYDITGQLVTVLLNEYKPKGVHTIKFNASDLPSGVYFYNVVVYEKYGVRVKHNESKKMILIK